MPSSKHWQVCSFALLLALGLICTSAQPALATRYARPDLQAVPIAQLIENLTKLVKDKPDDLALQNNLARAHAMAYASDAEQVEFLRQEPERGIWFGFEPKNLPFAAGKGRADAEQREDAQQHLQQAIKIYEAILKADKEQLVARLGYAWCLEQDGKTDKTIEQYRQVIAEAWEKEKDLQRGGLGFHSIVAEAADYLVPLLDTEKNADEIAELKTRSEKLNALPRPITPIAIPLRAGMSAEQMLNASAAVNFDADGSGRTNTRWSWITADAAWLVHDPHHTGEITSALQLFGNVTFWMFWEQGYQPLAALDDDGDGELRGPELQDLALWHDVNGNGVSEPGEVQPLSAHDIVALNCGAQLAAPAQQGSYAAWSATGVTYADGETRPTYDLVLDQAMMSMTFSKTLHAAAQ